MAFKCIFIDFEGTLSIDYKFVFFHRNSMQDTKIGYDIARIYKVLHYQH
jgi:hypothetical protein